MTTCIVKQQLGCLRASPHPPLPRKNVLNEMPWDRLRRTFLYHEVLLVWQEYLCSTSSYHTRYLEVSIGSMYPCSQGFLYSLKKGLSSFKYCECSTWANHCSIFNTFCTCLWHSVLLYNGCQPCWVFCSHTITIITEVIMKKKSVNFVIWIMRLSTFKLSSFWYYRLQSTQLGLKERSSSSNLPYILGNCMPDFWYLMQFTQWN